MRSRIPWLISVLTTLVMLKIAVVVLATVMSYEPYEYTPRRGEEGHLLKCRVVYDGYKHVRRGDCEQEERQAPVLHD